MLSAAVADLARRDSAIPGLSVVLDPDAFADALRCAAPAADLRTARIAFLKYKPHTYCQVTYRIDVAGTEWDVAAHACRPEDLPTVPRGGDGRSPGADGPLGAGRIALEQCAVLVTVFTSDPSVPALRLLMDPVERPRLLRDVLPDRPDLWNGELRTLRYRPERRYVAELRGAGTARALLKCYGPTGYERSKPNATAFQSRGALRVARLLGHSGRHGLLVFEWLPGRALPDICTAPELDGRPVTRTGSALAALHAQDAAGLIRRTRDDEVAALLALSAEIGVILPRLARRVDEVARRLGASLAGAPRLHLPLHGDFSAKQVLVTGRRAAILDLDRACRGDPAADLGNFVAAAERYVVRGLATAGRVERLRDALFEGYERATGLRLPERIDLYTALGLLRRARLSFCAHEPDWPRRMDALVERAEAVFPGTARAAATPELPDDAALPGLAAIRSRGLAGAIPALGLGGDPVGLALRSYSPGDRATLEARAGDRRLAVRLYAEDPAGEAELYQALAGAELAGGSGARVPRLLACERTLRVLVTDWLEGVPATRLIEGGKGARAGELAAWWLRRAASLPLRLGPPCGAGGVLYQTGRSVVELGTADPALGAAAEAVARRLSRAQPKHDASRLVHGDFCAGNILDLGDGPGVIGWRQFGHGPLELDAGMFLATVSCIGLGHGPVAAAAARAEEAFLARTRGVLDERALPWFRAAALLDLGARLVKVGSPEEARVLVAEAARLAEHAAGRDVAVQVEAPVGFAFWPPALELVLQAVSTRPARPEELDLIRRLLEEARGRRDETDH
jgi:aminoglycoside phosphotransferase (APT) family kinase protein